MKKIIGSILSVCAMLVMVSCAPLYYDHITAKSYEIAQDGTIVGLPDDGYGRNFYSVRTKKSYPIVNGKIDYDYKPPKKEESYGPKVPNLQESQKAIDDMKKKGCRFEPKPEDNLVNVYLTDPYIPYMGYDSPVSVAITWCTSLVYDADIIVYYTKNGEWIRMMSKSAMLEGYYN